MKAIGVATVPLIVSAFSVAAFCAARTHGEERSTLEKTVLVPPDSAAKKPADYPGLHNSVSYSAGLISGSVPEGDHGFETLKSMGVKTVISVDGAVPDLARAEARGMRYVHLPIGYNGMDRQRTMQIARAIQAAQSAIRAPRCTCTAIMGDTARLALLVPLQ